MTTIQETQQSLAQRASAAHEASRDFDYEQAGSLATFWRQATPGTAYWRGFVPMQALPGQVLPLEPDSLGLKDVPGTDGAQLLVLHKHEGTAIWQFLGDDSRSRIALQLRRQGVRTLMEVDDLYLRFADGAQHDFTDAYECWRTISVPTGLVQSALNIEDHGRKQW
jgi:hypothetical protein